MSDRESTESTRRPRVALWKKLLLALSVLVMIGALAAHGYATMRGGEASPSQVAGEPLLPSGFAPAGAAGEAAVTEQRNSLDEWSPAIFRLGFSFFLGFCIGFAVRTFLKLSLLAIGVIALAVFGLQYAGIVDVNWQAASGHYDSILQWLREQTSSFTAFIQGHLPSAGLATFGLIAGLKR